MTGVTAGLARALRAGRRHTMQVAYFKLVNLELEL